MSRYFIKRAKPEAGFDWWDAGPLLPGVSVPDHEATNTGLIDKSGQPIMRAVRPIGFGRDKEW